eukprot:scaffold18751_cov245-Isochrysis_galbana.AAC.4
MSATKREQQRRWMALHGYALHGYDEYGRPLRHHWDGYNPDAGYVGGGRDGRGLLRSAIEEDEETFWTEFENGRRGRLGQAGGARGGLLLQVFALDQMLSRMREEEEGEGEGEEEWEEDECAYPEPEYSSFRR